MTDTILEGNHFLFSIDPRPGFQFAADSDTLTIAEEAIVGSSLGDGVSSAHLNNVLTNNGMILSGNARIYFGNGDVLGGNGVLIDRESTDGVGGTIINNASGAIIGALTGIYISWGVAETITNHGTIMGLDSVGVAMGVTDQIVLTNDGEIYGRHAGVSDTGHTTIRNIGNGVIRSDHDGIVVSSGAGQKTLITNDVEATIRGEEHSILTVDGSVSVNNRGTLVGDIACASPAFIGNDTIVNRGVINGSISLGWGRDTYKGQGDGVVTGAISGGDGRDQFLANSAKETFFGDAGADVFIFKTVESSPNLPAQRDTVADFNSSEGDKVNLRNIDADATTVGQQDFVFIGAQTFEEYHDSHPGIIGVLRFADARPLADVDGDFHADFGIRLTGVTALQSEDLILV